MEPILRFAAIADVQYADKDDVERKLYRSSLDCLKACVKELNQEKYHDLDFTVQVGDLIDGNESEEKTVEDLQTAVKELNQISTSGRPHYNVIGNHCVRAPRSILRKVLLTDRNLEKGSTQFHYFTFCMKGWRFIVLDHQSISFDARDVEDGTQEVRHEEAKLTLAALEGKSVHHAVAWGGALGEEQRQWFRKELEQAKQSGERVGIFSHIPVYREATSERHLAWDYEQVLSLLDSFSDIVKFYMAGHYHAGGYALRNGVHHITLEAMLETDLSKYKTSYAIVSLDAKSIIIEGEGNCTSRTLWI